MADEQEIFAGGDVRVTTSRVVIGSTTYALANITSVSMFTEPKPVGVLLLAILLALGGVSCVLVDIADSRGVGFVEVVVGVTFGVYYFFGAKPTYWVRLGTAGAETNTISGTKEWIGAVVSAINEAIVRR